MRNGAGVDHLYDVVGLYQGGIPRPCRHKKKRLKREKPFLGDDPVSLARRKRCPRGRDLT